jgi:hypothetical protein
MATRQSALKCALEEIFRNFAYLDLEVRQDGAAA